jgi:uncharacterized protein (DUF1015 family)
MVRVQPFRALRYDPARVEPARVVCPPHDVVTAEERLQCAREPLSMVHVVLPEDLLDAERRFDRAAHLLAEWRAQGFLVRDDAPALYRYEATYGPTGGRRTMRGFFARVGLDATHTQVRPHERTLAGKKGDRLRLRQATQCDLEPIWLLHRDDADAVGQALGAGRKLLDVTDAQGTTHRVFRVDDAGAVAAVRRLLDGQPTVIADGHHRYRSALEHFAATGRAEDAGILALLVRDADPGLQVEATHRLVAWGRTSEEALAAARTRWDVRRLPLTERAAPDHVARELLQSLEAPGSAVLVARDEAGLHAYLLRLRERPPADALAVALVQERLLREAWGLEESVGGIRYERDAARCLEAVQGGHADLAVLLPPERVSSVLDAARQGRLMPAKATYFVPKPASGLVLMPLDEA